MSRTAERACVAVLALTSSAILAQEPAPSKPPAFRTGVDLVIVEATVTDRTGEVARGLTSADFEVEIGGRARDVVSAELVEYQATATADPARPVLDVTTNSDAISSRTVLIVADRGSLGTDSHSLIEAARRWLGTLGSTDRVGLVALPPPGPRVEFTTDHAQVSAALGKVRPAGGISPAQFSMYNVGLWEAIRITEQDQITRNLVVTRECPPQDLTCPGEIDITARDIVAEALTRTQPTLAALRNVLHAMRVLPGPKHVVLLSAGWPIDPRTTVAELEPVAAAAARANIIVHAFLAERSGMDASVRRLSPTLGQDRSMVLSSVETLAGWTGGQSARVVGSGDAAFESLSRVLAGYYRLGVRAAPNDLDGKTRRISVKVLRRGVSIRTHRRVMAAVPKPAEPTNADPATALAEAIKSNTPLTGLALRATSYILHEEQSAPDRLRVLIAGDVTGGIAGGASLRLALFDENGRMASGADRDIQIPEQGPAPISAALSARPGLYVLRIAVRDEGARVGSLERPIDLRWRRVGGFETTGLALFHMGRAAGSTPAPVVDTVHRDERLVAQLAFSASKPGTPEPSPVIQITREGGSTPFLRLPARVARMGAGPRRLAQETVHVSLLPPGRYTIAALMAPGVPPLTRSIDVLPDAAPPVESTASSVSPSAGAMAAHTRLATLGLARPAPFETSQVLDPARVAPILAQLRDRVSDAAVRDALDRVKSGPWPTDVSKGPLTSAPAAGHFVAGLGRLQAGEIELAANNFRSALRAAPDFIPAVAYLAACYAAGGMDKEAASAWQTALLRDRESPWLQQLAIEAWLRAERPTAALALLKLARQRFPDHETFVRLQAKAELAAGFAREGLETVASIPDPDESLLLMALATLYAAARDGAPVWDGERDLAAMKRWREAYAAANGGSLGLVDAWLAEMSPASQ